jgi:uncharacterized membrane protein
MRKGLLVVGVILLVIGIGLAAYSQVGSSQTVTIPAEPNVLVPTFNILSPATVSVSWSGAAAGTVVELFQCTDSTCSAIASVVANATGSSGSFSGTVSPGNHYGLTVIGSQAVSATVTTTGITYLTVIGIVLAVIGAILAILSLRRSKQPAANSTSSGPTPVEGVAPTDSGVGELMGSPANSDAAGGRANRVCAYCGTVNEPWLTNCRKCKRPLASTGA